MEDGKPFTFAGLREDREREEVRFRTVFATGATGLMREDHNRMPVILPPTAPCPCSISSSAALPRSLPLLVPYPSVA